MKKYGFSFLCMLLLLFLGLSGPQAKAAGKQTIHNSPYVAFSPDGKAWTTNPGDRTGGFYKPGTRVDTGIPSSLRKPGKGEHYYKAERTGEIPVGYWEVYHQYGNCIHNNYPASEDYHKISHRRNNCFSHYYSGWGAVCADCGDALTEMLIYMSREAAASIDYLEMGDVGRGFFYDYYYLCPHCANLEQGRGLLAHKCNAISWNQYKVSYHYNVSGTEAVGYMPDSCHMYDNQTEYEGETVTPLTRLTPNTYTRIGYEFAGWNTRPDGSGAFYADEEEIYNLSCVDWRDESTWTAEDNGRIILYAQWRPSESTLVIDGNGGSYRGQEQVDVTRAYGSVYRVSEQEVNPPAGHLVSFDTKGGSPAEAIRGTRHFTEWSINPDYKGEWKNSVYTFIGPDKNADTLTANYAHDPVILPDVSKPGYSFGGWYLDEACKKPAGGPGDVFLPSEDTVLYAQWVDLQLKSEDNYRANGGRGAVDLSWKQPDGKDKVYLLYQSRTGEADDWVKINDSSDIGNGTRVQKSFAFTGSSGSYTIPYAGIYTLTAQGAQGGNHGSCQGGKGGRVSVGLWLEKGEKVSYFVGGQNGAGGGGRGTMFENGGGYTILSTDKKGTVMIAGGGGSATPFGDGNPGGSQASVIGNGNINGAAGQDGGAGGGGGYQGGAAGEHILHYHTDACYRDTSRQLLESVPVDKTEKWVTDNIVQKVSRMGSAASLIPVEGNTKLRFAGVQNYVYSNTHPFEILKQGCYIRVYNQNGRLIFQQSLADLEAELEADFDRAVLGEGAYSDPGLRGYSLKLNENYDFDGNGNSHFVLRDNRWLHYRADGTVERYSSTSYSNGEAYNYRADLGKYLPGVNAAMFWKPEIAVSGSIFYKNYTHTYRCDISIPKDTTGIWIEFSGSGTLHWGNEAEPRVTYAYLSGGRDCICGYTQGQAISSKPAYGGSNYVNTKLAYNYADEAGKRTGNGSVSLESESIGYVEAFCLDAVTAQDKAPPEPVSESSIEKNTMSEKRVRITWREPADKGTDYYHKAESYLRGSKVLLCTSNITKNTLTSGVEGYYFVLDETADTQVTAANGSYTADRRLVTTVSEKPLYLHLAAVDAAGNVSDTVHIGLNEKEVLWKLHTKQLAIEEGENVYPAGEDKVWYVKADGRTPFLLSHSGYMEGTASFRYQPNHTIYETTSEGNVSRNIITTPSNVISEEEIMTKAENLFHAVEGKTLLEQYPYSYTIRSDKCRRLESRQKFTLPQETSGKRLEVIPILGADTADGKVYSDYTADKRNGITLIADGEGPTITGLEGIEDKDLIHRGEGKLILQLTAIDFLSGVREFYAEARNLDNQAVQRYNPKEDGSIAIEATADKPVFSGDFVLTVYAVDNVGNMTEMEAGATEFALETRIERIKSPHEPVFKGGESGVLTITTWGYPDYIEIEFPEEMAGLNPELNRTVFYKDTPLYRQQEQLQFMIPLYTPPNQNYTITVRAYKGDKRLEDYPAIGVISVGENVLGEFRTRLR